MRAAAVHTERLSVRFGTVDALRAVSVTVPDGSFVSIIGPNGAGKTTFLNVVLGLLEASAGVIEVFGNRPSALPKSMVGYIPQRKTIDPQFPARALDLVVTGIRGAWPWRIRSEERALALAAMERCKVAALANRAVGALSGGELQRVYLARSIMRNPKLLVLDEPAAGLDRLGEADLYHILEGYRADTGATVLMITHDWEGARSHASHALLIADGLTAFGPPEEVAREDRLLEVFGHTGHRAATHRGDGHA
jgi:zinc transport system ATP-binding protein